MNNINKVLALSLALLFACGSNNSRITSLKIDDLESRILTIEDILITKSDILDAEYDFFSVNGFDTNRLIVPGATSYDYKMVIKVDPNLVADWTSELIGTDTTISDFPWVSDLTKTRINNWSASSRPKYYEFDDSYNTMIVYESEGIIYKRVFTD